MKTKMMKVKTTLMTVSILAMAMAAGSAYANPSVMCSIRAGYQGGVSVDGKPVVPADLDPAPVQSVRIPLTVDLAQRMNEILPDGLKLESQTGIVDILGNGHVLFNGKDMTGPANVLCSNISKERDAALKTKDAPKKAARPRRAADVPANVDEAVKAQPVTPVAAEPVPAEPVVEEPAPVVAAPEPEVVPEPAPVLPEEAAQEPQPQVLQPAEEVLVAPPAMPEPTPVPAPTPAPAPEMPPQPAEIISPTEGGMIPRPPTDPFAPPPEEEMLSGGGQ